MFGFSLGIVGFIKEVLGMIFIRGESLGGIRKLWIYRRRGVIEGLSAGVDFRDWMVKMSVNR